MSQGSNAVSAALTQVPALLEKEIGRRIADALGILSVAKRLDALPIVNQMGSTFLLKRDGEVVSFNWDSANDCATETDPRIRNIVLFEAAGKYPDLIALRPERSARDVTCPKCKGTGKDPIAERLSLPGVSCYCGGLGWIPADDPLAG
jgi:hypothetical protein